MARSKFNLLGRNSVTGEPPRTAAERLRAHEQALSFADPRVRADAARGVAMMAKAGVGKAARAQKLLAPMLTDTSILVRLSAAGGLTWIDPVTWAPKLHGCLLDAISRGVGAAEIARATSQLIAFGDATLKESLRQAAEAAARDEGSRVVLATEVLGQLAASGDAAAVRPLAAILSDPKIRNQEAAARALARAKLPEAADALRRWRKR